MIKQNDYIFDDRILIEYQREYYKNSDFHELKFKGNDKKNNVINFSLTIEKKKNFKILNNFNYPIFLDAYNLNTNSQKEIRSKIKEICKTENIDSILFKKIIEEKDINNILAKKKYLSFVGAESIIKLDKDLDLIKKNFSKGHKSALKRNYENISYELIDFKNYKKNEILNMMKLHEIVSGKKTRSEKTWLLNEKMILNKKGLLIKIKEGSETISYSFFFNNLKTSLYFSSCTIRNKFKIYNNLTHKVIWEAIKYFKSNKCENFYLGITKSLFSTDNLDLKAKNIDLFKSSFGGEKSFFAIYNNFEIL